LQKICNEGINYVDFSILYGHRNKKDQNSRYPKYTKLRWPNSRHNKFPSRAIDVAPYIKPYGTITGHDQQIRQIAALKNISHLAARQFVFKAYARLIGILEGIAFKEGIGIRVGLDWDGDFDLLDQTFNDLAHIELKEDEGGFKWPWS